MINDDYVPSDADAPDDIPEPTTGAGDLGLSEGGSAYDEDAEKSAVGAMMLDQTVIDDVVEQLSPSDFWNPKHEVISRAIVNLHARREPTDVIAVVEELARTNELRNAGGATYLHELTGIVRTR